MPLRTIVRQKSRYIQEGDQLLSEHAAVLHPLIESLSDYLELAVLKATAHYFDASAHPMANVAENSLEQVLLRRLEALPQAKLALAKFNLDMRLERMRLLEAQSEDLPSNLGSVSILASEEPLSQLIAPMIMQRTRHLVERMTVPATAPASLMSYQGNVKAILRIHRVLCVDETDPEGGDDEISLGGTAVHADGHSQKLSYFEVADDMDDDEPRVFEPPILYAHYDIVRGTDTSTYPKYICCFLMLVEEDMGGIDSLFDDLFKEVRSKVEAAVAAWSSTFLGPLGPVIGVATGALLGKLWDLFKQIWEDDPFPPAKVDLLFRSPRANFNGSDYSPMYSTHIYGYGGHYQIDYSWQIVGRADWLPDNPPAILPPPVPDIEGIIVFKNVNFDGDQRLFKKGIHRLGGGEPLIRNGIEVGITLRSPFNDEIDSIKVGRGYYAWLFKTPDLTGPFLEIREDVHAFNDDWRDQISSIIVFAKG